MLLGGDDDDDDTKELSFNSDFIFLQYNIHLYQITITSS